jgi:hypothetical protein
LVLLKQALEVADRSLGLDHPTTRFIHRQWEEVRAALADRENWMEVATRDE